MDKRLVGLACLLSITIASVPAYAENKKVTLDCNSFSAMIITGTAKVSLCDDSAVQCSGATSLCPALACDSSGASAPASVSAACSAGFKVGAVMFAEDYADGGVTGAQSSGTHVLAKGKVGFISTQLSGNSDGNTVILEVK